MHERLKNYAALTRDIALGQLSSIVFGNDVGIRNNLLGDRLVREARCGRGETWHDAEPEADALRETGFVALPGLYDDRTIASLAARFDELVQDPDHSMARIQSAERGLPDASRNLTDPLASIPALATLITERVQRILRAYYGSHFCWIDLIAYRNRHVPDASREYYSNLWHYDHINTAYLQLFVYLSDNVNRYETGAFRIHTKAQSRKISRSGFLHRRIVIGPAKRRLNDPSLVHHMEGGAGTAFLVANAQCLHAAGVPKAGHQRDAVVFSFLPAAAPFDGGLMKMAHHSYGS